MKLKSVSAATLILELMFVHICWGQRAPSVVNYQGRLADVTAAPLVQGIYALEFRLWDAPNNGNLIWGEEQTNVTVRPSGAFGVILGSGSPLPAGPTPSVNDLSFAFTAPNRYLGVTITRSNGTQIAGPSEIMPRQMLFSAPFALVSADGGNSPGTISPFGGETPPLGWLACEGQPVSSVVYPALFAAIGTYWGAGIPGTTNNFSLPDMRGAFARGWNHEKGRDPDASSRTGGDQVGSYQGDAFGSHTHTVFDPGHQHAVAWQSLISGEFNRTDTNGFKPIAASGPPNPTTILSYTGIGLQNSGGSSETRPKNVAVMYIIKY